MWTKNNYRRIFLDMHIDDWNPQFLSKLNPKAIVETLKNAGTQTIVIKAKPHTGLCYWPCSIGHMHKGLNGMDYVGEMICLCKEKGIATQVYYSQIYDNWAYQNHPSWRTVRPDGTTSMESPKSKRIEERYGTVCPNNIEYREYVKLNLQELNTKYSFDGMFLDMAFWPCICYCSSCKERYLLETGHEMPRTVDWNDPQWLHFQSLREKWLSEFVDFSSDCVKKINPSVTIEHNFSTACTHWGYGSTDQINEASDYAGGDLYGGLLQESFICKYYRNVSKTLPFVFITSRCDPDLGFHTTTKTTEELVLHAAIALAHNGAFNLCDGINPDGSICPDIYSTIIKKSFSETQPFEKYVESTEIQANISIWFPSRAKFLPSQNGKSVEAIFDNEHLDSPLGLASILKGNNIPFDIIPSKKLSHISTEVLALSNVAFIDDDEMDLIEKYVKNGGNLYLSGLIAHKRLADMLGVEDIGLTEHQFTYMSPTELGTKHFEGFTQLNPLSIRNNQLTVKLKNGSLHKVLANIVVPYTTPGGNLFAAIHSNPPGTTTDFPAVFEVPYGKGRILYAAAAIETSKPHMCRQVVANLIRSLCDILKFTSNAPACAEIMYLKNNDRKILVILNEQETSPFIPLHEVYIEVPEILNHARILEKKCECKIEHTQECTRIYLPKIERFLMVEIS